MASKKVTFNEFWKKIQLFRGLAVLNFPFDNRHLVFTYNPHTKKAEFLADLNNKVTQFTKAEFKEIWEKFFKILWIDLKSNTISSHYSEREIYAAIVIRYIMRSFF